MTDISGSSVALVAPMHKDGQLDYISFKNILRMHLKSGVPAVVLNGTTGESPTLTQAERLSLVEIAKNEIGDKVLVIAGTGTNDTATTIECSKAAIAAGADACLLICPYYNKPTQKGLFTHFNKIADSISKPIILYNHPGRTGVDLSAEITSALSNHQNIIGIKEASGDVTRVSQLAVNCAEDFTVLSGDDALTCSFIAAGAKGVISVAANIVPSIMNQLVEHSLKKEKIAYEINSNLQELFAAISVETNPIPIKWAMFELGLIPEGIRLPLLPLSDQYKKELSKVLRKYEIAQQVQEFI